MSLTDPADVRSWMLEVLQTARVKHWGQLGFVVISSCLLYSWRRLHGLSFVAFSCPLLGVRGKFQRQICAIGAGFVMCDPGWPGKECSLLRSRMQFCWTKGWLSSRQCLLAKRVASSACQRFQCEQVACGLNGFESISRAPRFMIPTFVGIYAANDPKSSTFWEIPLVSPFMSSLNGGTMWVDIWGTSIITTSVSAAVILKETAWLAWWRLWALNMKQHDKNEPMTVRRSFDIQIYKFKLKPIPEFIADVCSLTWVFNILQCYCPEKRCHPKGFDTILCVCLCVCAFGSAGCLDTGSAFCWWSLAWWLLPRTENYDWCHGCLWFLWIILHPSPYWHKDSGFPSNCESNRWKSTAHHVLHFFPINWNIMTATHSPR